MRTFDIFIMRRAAGFFAGPLITRIFIKSSIEQETFGQAIEYGMTHDNISKLRSTTSILV